MEQLIDSDDIKASTHAARDKRKAAEHEAMQKELAGLSAWERNRALRLAKEQRRAKVVGNEGIEATTAIRQKN